MKFIFILCFLLSAYSALANIDWRALSPYRVIGVKCLQGEHCREQSLDPYKGFYLKSNIPLDDQRQSRIRVNMITKAVLESQIIRCKASRGNNLNSDRCQPHSNSPTNPFRRRGIKCNHTNIYCKKISSGPYAGLVEKSNVDHTYPNYGQLPLQNGGRANRECIRDNRNVNCGKNTPPVRDSEVYIRIGIRCDSHSIYCERINSGRYQGFIKKSNILPSDTRYAQTAVVVTPHLLNCHQNIMGPNNIIIREERRNPGSSGATK